ncbi:MAG TPA: BON domain-containing protein [Steroidobacteraceae bacterium]|nr:BON domain-containing protein [Steroidobacteraceae bacterium]
MKPDSDIKKDVEAELRWSPEVNETDIAVKVTDGEVTLTGYVHRYFEKYQAEIAVKRVKGVVAVANDIEVRSLADAPTDPEIARAAMSVLKIELPLAWEGIKPVVQQGRVRLEGTVEWHYERERAESAVRRLGGVVSVLNQIRIEPRIAPQDIKHRIEDAFRRIAQLDANQISVDAHGSDVTLRGEVRSWAERDQAQQTAWSAPGVARVMNELTVRT